MRTSRGRAVALGLLAATWPVLWYVRAYALDGPAKLLIPAFVLSIFATVVAWGGLRSRAATRLAQVAFGLVAAGDVAINVTPWPAAAVPAFIGAHLALAAAFLCERPLAARDLPLLIPASAAALAFARAHLPRLAGARAAGLVVYLLALVAMLWRALCAARAERRMRGAFRVAGAVLFFATDLITIAEVSDRSRTYAGWIWAIYPPALIGLACSCWRARNSLPQDQAGPDVADTSAGARGGIGREPA